MLDFSNLFGRLSESIIPENKRLILSLCEENSDAKLLDLGCSDGEHTVKIAERIGTHQIWGLDIVEGSIAKAKERGIDVRRADLNKPLPFESESFDVIHASQILEHLYNTDTFLKEVYRVLKKGGYFIISVPNLTHLANILFLALGRQPMLADVSNEVRGLGSFHFLGGGTLEEGNAHLRMFTVGALKELIQHHGLKVEKIIGVGFYPLPVPLARVMSAMDKWHSVLITVKARKK